MNEEIITACFQLITFVGTARSYFINAIQCAKAGKYDEASNMLKQGDEAFVQGHQVHSDLAQKESNGEMGTIGLLLLHAEDQLMSAEGFRIIAEELIAVYKQLDHVAPSVPKPECETPVPEEATSAQEIADIEIVKTATGAKQFKYVIQDALGIHARPAGLLAKEAKAYADTTVTVTKDGNTVKATQLMKLMSLAVKKGDEVTVAAEGPQEDEAIVAMAKFFKEHL